MAQIEGYQVRGLVTPHPAFLLAKVQAADVMASIVAERIVDRLEAANFVVMRRPRPGHMSKQG